MKRELRAFFEFYGYATTEDDQKWPKYDSVGENYNKFLKMNESKSKNEVWQVNQGAGLMSVYSLAPKLIWYMEDIDPKHV